MARCVPAQAGAGGPRGSNGDTSPAFSRCPRMRSMTIGSVIHAITFISCPHVAHTSGSTSNTRFTSRRQADRRFASGEPLGAGVTGSAGLEGWKRRRESPSFSSVSFSLPGPSPSSGREQEVCLLRSLRFCRSWIEWRSVSFSVSGTSSCFLRPRIHHPSSGLVRDACPDPA